MTSPYSALIRTYNSGKTLAAVLESVQAQNMVPRSVLLVDSGSTDNTLSIAKEYDVQILHYPSEEDFNYSKSLNMGFAQLHDDWILCLSSHTRLSDRHAVEKMFEEVQANENLIAAYAVTHRLGSSFAAQYVATVIGQDNFDGYNGLSNSCSFVRRAAWERQSFSEVVWAAEDQAWAAVNYRSYRSCTVRVEGLDVVDLNPRSSAWKSASDFVSIATHSFTSYGAWSAILRDLLRGLWSSIRSRHIRGGQWLLQRSVCLLLYKLGVLEFKSLYHAGPPRWLGFLFSPVKVPPQ